MNVTVFYWWMSLLLCWMSLLLCWMSLLLFWMSLLLCWMSLLLSWMSLLLAVSISLLLAVRTSLLLAVSTSLLLPVSNSLSQWGVCWYDIPLAARCRSAWWSAGWPWPSSERRTPDHCPAPPAPGTGPSDTDRRSPRSQTLHGTKTAHSQFHVIYL